MYFMEKAVVITMVQLVLSILLVVVAVVSLLLLGFSYFFPFYGILGFVMFIRDYISIKEIKKSRKLGEALFLKEFGVEADKAELSVRLVTKYYRLKGISKKSFHVTFRSQGKVYKGILDREHQILHIQKPVLLPVYTDDAVPVWRYVLKMYKNGEPKKVGYYDENEQLCGEEYLDEKGMLKRKSWRRRKGIEEYWYPAKQVWEP